jgi:hypothetical protein
MKKKQEYSKKEYLKAKWVVDEYTCDVNKSLIKSMTCCSCKKKVLHPINNNGHTKGSEMEFSSYSGGTVERINFSYGSKRDGESYFIAICDDCIDRLELEGIVFNTDEIVAAEDARFEK